MKTNAKNRKHDARRNVVRKLGTNRRSRRQRKSAKLNIQRQFAIEQLEIRQLLASDCGPNNLIANCSFEDAQAPALRPTAAEIFHVIPAGSTAIANWQPGSHPDDPDGNIDWVRETAWLPSEGDLSIDLSGTPGRGSISQTISTVPGVRYDLTFDLAANPVGSFHPNGSNPTKTLQVSAAGQSKVFTYTLSPNADGNHLAWDTNRWSFVANSTSTTLEFLALGPDPRVDNDPNDNADFGPALDRVHLARATTGSIHGVAYEDLDGDGVRDPSDPGLDGKRIHLLNFNNNPFTLDGALDTNPIFGQNGAYVFAELPPATYRVHEIQQPGWVSTLPPGNVSSGTTGFHEIDFQQGQIIAGISFPSVALGSIHGFKFEDLNANGVYEKDTERPQSDVQFVLSGVTGLGVEVNRVATSDAAGMFSYEGLLPSVAGQGQGTGYTVTEVVPGGFYSTRPAPFHADLYSGKELVAFKGQAMLPETVTVQLGGSKLRGDRGDAERMAGPFSTLIPAGDYTLTLVSSDFGPDHGTQGQVNEQYFLRGFDAANNIVFQSPPIDDLPNHLNQLTQVVAQRIRLGSDVVAVTAVHISAAGVQGANSIEAVRAVFEPLDPRMEEPADLLFGNARTSTIQGQKFRDLDADGQRDANEPGLNGWTIQLVDTQTANVVQEVVTQSRGGVAGMYSFTDVVPGTFKIREVEQPGWMQTFPASESYELIIGADQTTNGLDFGNSKFSSIHGAKFEDLDGDGQRDEEEPGLNLWSIQLVDAATGRVVKEQLTHPEDGVPGRYWFHNVPPGSYEVRETAQEGWSQTFPESGVYSVTVGLEQTLNNFDFGNRQITSEIQGFKFEDLDRDGVFDPGEPGMGGVVIYLDGNANGEREFGEIFVQTAVDDPATPADETGSFSFTGLSAGNYIVAEESPPGFEQSFPVDGAPHVVELAAGEIVTGLLFGNQETPNFGNVRYAQVHGLKYYDQDGDGSRDPAEPGVPGIVIYADLNRNGIRDVGEPATRTMEDDPTTPADETGEYWLKKLSPGDYLIREVIAQADVVQTFPGGELLGHEVTLASGQVLTGIDFGNTHLCGVHGWKWEDLDLDGRIDPNEPGVAGVTIYADLNRNGVLDEGEPSTQSMADDPTTPRDETGQYWLEKLPPGEYVIREIVPEDWANVYPVGGSHLVFVENCGRIEPSPADTDPIEPIEIATPSVPDAIVAPATPLSSDNPLPPSPIDQLPPIVAGEPVVQAAPVQISAPFLSRARLLAVNLDVSSDGIISEHDVQMIIQDIQKNGLRVLDRDADGELQDDPYDVNQDGWVAPMDVLLIINALAVSSHDEAGSSVEIAALPQPVLLISEPAGLVRELIRSNEPRTQAPSSLDESPSVNLAGVPRAATSASLPAERPSSSRELALDELLSEGQLDALVDEGLLHDLLL